MDLKERRTKAGLTQEAVARAVGVSLYAYQRWERGACNPLPHNAAKLDRVLENPKAAG